ncbi:uncharacterized protein LOC112199498 [Rosa chinensis]|uniref:uncharacterized protein LOC112199498 n=1 Tax=Rosa chinensis TaxID=74649 RepID=UPI000D091CEA|nr:uncharacterized protein LOC112199498 [Rosa chinensis]
MKALGQKLSDWHRVDFNKQQIEMRVIQEKLNDLMRQPHSVQLYEEQGLLHVQYSHLHALQEKYWKQRSRALWLKEGDRNTAYFHRKQAIGRKIFSAEIVNMEALQNLLIDATPCKVTNQMNEMLVAPYIDEEIKRALFQMHPSKSPGPDGRLISDNTLVANEAAHFMHKLKHQDASFFSLKLDISKAYDRLDWSFIFAILTRLGFADQWIQIIMKCVTSVTYSIFIQGALISQAVNQHTIQGLTICPQAPTLHHLFFANDSILFGSATNVECVQYKFILDTYEKALGQKVNFQKSSVVFSNNVKDDRQQELASILGVQCVKEHDKYLGLPMRVGRSKSAIFAYIKEKLTKKISQLEGKDLKCSW